MARTGGPLPPYGEAIQQAVASGSLTKMKAAAKSAESYLAKWGNVPAALEALRLEIAKAEGVKKPAAKPKPRKKPRPRAKKA